MIEATALGTADKLRKDIHKARSMTGKPFGVNLSLIGHPHIDELRDVAIKSGMKTLRWDALQKVHQGVTSAQEAINVMFAPELM